MECCYSSDMVNLLGPNALYGSSLAQKDGDTVHFMVSDYKQDNFMKYCNSICKPLNPIKTINEYTEHTTKHYAKVNLALAADTNALETFGDYIKQLRNSIFNKPLYEQCLLYRGVDLSTQEISQMESLQSFYIPSFTSTSIDSTKAYSKSTLMVIKTLYASQYACSITEDLSKYYSDEREVLISCYSAFRLERIEKDNNKTIISLYLDDYLSSLDSLSTISHLSDI